MEAKFNLILQTLPEIGKVFRVESETCSIGRDPENSIMINHPEVSRKHAILVNENGTYFIQDLGSMNGTYVDGERVDGVHGVSPGDIISMGETVSFIFQPIQNTQQLTPLAEETLITDPLAAESEAEYPEPVEEIHLEEADSMLKGDGKKPGNSKMREFTRLLAIILIVVLVCIVIGFVLFIWFIDHFALWCTVLPFLFQPGVCP